MAKNSLPPLTRVYKKGFFDFRFIDGATYERTRKEFRKSGTWLPTWDKLKNLGKRSDLRLLLSDLTIDVKFKDNTGLRYDFKRGYITDLASVPDYFRSFVDNDDIDIIAAALVHDRGFSIHNLNFKQTNELFYKMFLARDGLPGSDERWLSLPRRARLAWWAVSSFVGRRLWYKNQKKRRAWTLNTSRFVRLTYGK
jgi:hypothetical protein